MQISLRVVKKVPSGENMAHVLEISVLKKDYSVVYSRPRDRAVKAYVVPGDINVYQQLSKKEQKAVRHEALTKIQESFR